MSYETVTLEEVYDNQTKRMAWLTAYHSRVFSKDGFTPPLIRVSILFKKIVRG
jgi:hypothetical protein